MHVQETLGLVDEGRYLRHQDAAGGGSQDGVVAAKLVDLPERLAFGLQRFRHPFEYQFRAAECLRGAVGPNEFHAPGNGRRLRRIHNA